MSFVFVFHVEAGKMAAEALPSQSRACGPKTFLCSVLAALTRDPSV